MKTYQVNPCFAIDILIPVEVAKKLGFKANAFLSNAQVQVLRQSLGLRGPWPLHTPMVSNRWLENGRG